MNSNPVSTHMKTRTPILWTVLAAWVVVLSAGCRKSGQEPVRAHVQGVLSVRAEVDSTRDWSDFEVSVISEVDGEVDTLAFVVTDSTGVFAFDLEVPARGIYPLVVTRGDAPLAFEQLVVADGDSVTIRAAFPLNGRPMRIVSRENAAWAAVRNAKASFNQLVAGLLEADRYEVEDMARTIMQGSNVLWSLRETYPGTMGASLAEAESIVMLEGWNDSLVLGRLETLPPDHPNIVDVIRAARRSMARLAGQDSALAFVERFASRVPADKRSAVRSEIVMAHIDSLQRPQALEAARAIIAEGGEWGAWAGRAVYELENLLPGMEAPPFTANDRSGAAVELAGLRGNIVMLEFYRPDATYMNDLVTREALLGLADRMPFHAVSVSVEPDSLLDAALFEGRDLAGSFIHDPDGLEGTLARAYNVNVLPTRILIDADGRIVSKYIGEGLDGLQRDLGSLLRQYGSR